MRPQKPGATLIHIHPFPARTNGHVVQLQPAVVDGAEPEFGADVADRDAGQRDMRLQVADLARVRVRVGVGVLVGVVVLGWG